MDVVAPEGLENAEDNELLAMLEVMYLVAKADGFFAADELREFLQIVSSLSEGKFGKEKLNEVVTSWTKRGPQDPDQRLAELAAALPDETSRRIAYGLALQIAEADGQFLESEASMLAKIARAFDLKKEESYEIAQSVRMSRRPKPG